MCYTTFWVVGRLEKATVYTVDESQFPIEATGFDPAEVAEQIYP